MTVFENSKQEYEKIKNELNDEKVLADTEKMISLSKKLAVIEKELDVFNKINNKLENIKLDIETINLEDSLSTIETEEYSNLIDSEIINLSKITNSLYLNTLLSEEYDNNNAIVTLHSGAGGTESYDFVEMLFRMLCRFIESEGLKISVLDTQKEDVGFKSISFKVTGENAYGMLKSEKGIHRLVRISPFDANKRRHTTFASIEVIPEIQNDENIILNSDELRIDTFRSGGAGGQHINKTDSAVRITHLPTNIVVVCQNERSQIQNKETALKILKSKLFAISKQQHLDKISEIKGESLKIEWGNQVRSYVFCPYTLVKDHRTNFETSDVESVMNGDLKDIVLAYLINLKTNKAD